MGDVVIEVGAYSIAGALSWGAQMLAMWIVQRFVNLTLPEFREWAWKVAAMLAAVLVLDMVPYVGWIAGVVLYWYLLRRWFDADLWAIAYVCVANAVISRWLVATTVALFDN